MNDFPSDQVLPTDSNPHLFIFLSHLLSLVTLFFPPLSLSYPFMLKLSFSSFSFYFLSRIYYKCNPSLSPSLIFLDHLFFYSSLFPFFQDSLSMPSIIFILFPIYPPISSILSSLSSYLSLSQGLFRFLPYWVSFSLLLPPPNTLLSSSCLPLSLTQYHLRLSFLSSLSEM